MGNGSVNCSLTYELPLVGGVTDFLRLCRIADFVVRFMMLIGQI